MSNTAFIELLSEDPVERAIGRRVVRILNDTSLERKRRVELVRLAQRDLRQHRREKANRAALAQHVAEQMAQAQLPKGFTPRSVQAVDGRLQIGGLMRSGQTDARSFVWVDAGLPSEAANTRTDTKVYALHRAGPGQSRVRKDLNAAIAERRQAMANNCVPRQVQPAQQFQWLRAA
jgi:hypothetical protein